MDTLGDKFIISIATLTTAIAAANVEVPRIVVPQTTAPQGRRDVRHTSSSNVPRSIDDLWLSEGVTPQRLHPVRRTELQILHGGHVFRFHDQRAFRRLAFLSSTAFMTNIGGRVEASIAECVVGNAMTIRISAYSLARSYAGATGSQITDWRTFCDLIVQDDWYPKTNFAGKLRNERFWANIFRVFIMFRMLAAWANVKRFAYVGQTLVVAMLESGVCRPPLVQAFLDSLVCLIREGSGANTFEKSLLAEEQKTQAMLWRCRRIFYKDDCDPKKNAYDAIMRMCKPRNINTEQDRIAHEALDCFKECAESFLSAHFSEIKQRHDNASLHRSSATVFFPRSEGGGGAELHFMVGLHRLFLGKESRLQDVWGHVSEHITVEEILGLMKQEPARRKEIEKAGLWFVSELDKLKMSYPFICIYPPRETKGRTFMLLTYAEQQGGYNAATSVSGFLRHVTDTREVFRGFETQAWLERMRSDVESRLDSDILWLDSAVATDPLPHDYCLRIFEPFNQVFSEFTKAMVARVFSPRRVHVSNGRPEKLLDRLSFVTTLRNKIGLKVTYTSLKQRVKRPALLAFRVHRENLPAVRTLDSLEEIVEKLARYRRIMFKASTGSGKTMLAAHAFNSCIQFPTIAALLIFQKNLEEMGSRHNVWYSGEKRMTEFDEVTGEPLSTLCTSFFLPIIMEKHPTLVAVLDEADAKSEYNLINLMLSRSQGWWTIITTATTEELRGEEDTVVVELPGGTNFPVEDDECTYDVMMAQIKAFNTPKSLVILHSEPLAERLALEITKAGRVALALTARRRQGDFLKEIENADVITSTNAIRTSVTLPIEWVFDCTQVYETVHFPLSGIDSLVLFQTSKSMNIQARGRVGRTAPGKYFSVHGAPGDPQPYSPKMLGRCDAIAKLLGKVPLSDFARELNIPAIIIERFHLNICQNEKVVIKGGAPLWVSIVGHYSKSHFGRMIELIGFEEAGIASRSRNLESDISMSLPFDRYQSFARRDYASAVSELLRTCEENHFFSQEIANLRRWQGYFELQENSEKPLHCEENKLALGIALWRCIAKEEKGQLVGLFRDFIVNAPEGWALNSGAHYVALGLSLWKGEVTCRSIISLPNSVIMQIITLFRRETVVVFNDLEGLPLDSPVIDWEMDLKNKGKQKRTMKLVYDRYTRNTVFSPEACIPILSKAVEGVLELRDGDDHETAVGSPMSSTASFPVLNGFGFAANERARRITKEKLSGASVFGDDASVAGSTQACNIVRLTREALGLETKESDTSLVAVRRKGKTIKQRSMGVYTERLVDNETLQEISSIKPAGVIRFFSALHPQDLIGPERVWLADMLSYERQIHHQHSDWSDIVTRGREDEPLQYARRTTAPRRILSGALTRELTPSTKLATGDIDRLFAHLESALLMVYPSTRGDPERVSDVSVDVLGHPAIGYPTAVRLAEHLQGQDCYFKLRGPPLRFNSKEYAASAAAHIASAKGIPIDSDDAFEAFHKLNWGSKTYPTEPLGDFESVEFEPFDLPIEDDDLLF